MMTESEEMFDAFLRAFSNLLLFVAAPTLGLVGFLAWAVS